MKSTPINKENTVTIDIKDMSVSQVPTILPLEIKTKSVGKQQKKVTNGSKIYISSKVVNALKHVKKHTEELSVKRTMQKDRMYCMTKSGVFDEGLLNHHSSIEDVNESNDYGYEESDNHYNDDENLT